MREDEDALICDFAAEYGVIDWRALPLHTAAALACGLSEDSRSVRRLTGAKAKSDTLLLAIIADGVRGIQWMLSEDGQKGRNAPESILAMIVGDKESDIEGFDSGEAFKQARQRIIEGMKDGN